MFTTEGMIKKRSFDLDRQVITVLSTNKAIVPEESEEDNDNAYCSDNVPEAPESGSNQMPDEKGSSNEEEDSGDESIELFL